MIGARVITLRVSLCLLGLTKFRSKTRCQDLRFFLISKTELNSSYVNPRRNGRARSTWPMWRGFNNNVLIEYRLSCLYRAVLINVINPHHQIFWLKIHFRRCVKCSCDSQSVSIHCVNHHQTLVLASLWRIRKGQAANNCRCWKNPVSTLEVGRVYRYYTSKEGRTPNGV